jgi:hypothetical protein
VKINFFLFFLLAFLIVLEGCTHSTGVQSQCVFTKTALLRDSMLLAKVTADSPETYTYKTQNVSMDSLLTSLCFQGFQIAEGWYSIRYLCKDLRGPRPVIILQKQDPTILQYGFEQGNTGRLACSDSVFHYVP